MSDIVVAIGLTGGSTAVRWAVQRARATGGSVRLMHVVDTHLTERVSDEMRQAVLQSADHLVAAALDTAEATAADVPVHTETVVGNSVEVYEQRSFEAELLVIAGDWRSAEQRGRRSVVAQRIAAASRCPVAMIPDLDLSGRSGVVVGVDGSAASAAALRFGASEAARLGEPLIAVHAWDVAVLGGGEFGYGIAFVANDGFEDAAAGLVDEAVAPIRGAYPDLEIRPVLVANDPVQALVEASAGAKLLVVGSTGRSALARFLLGSVSLGLLSDVAVPTVVIR